MTHVFGGMPQFRAVGPDPFLAEPPRLDYCEFTFAFTTYCKYMWSGRCATPISMYVHQFESLVNEM